jgi:thiol:disulfide interchange protein DsbD
MACLFVALLAGLGLAQPPGAAPPVPPGGFDQAGGLGGQASGGMLGQASSQPKVQVSAEFTAPADGSQGRLFVVADIEPGWHIYSLTQPPGGPVASEIEVEPSADYRLRGEFRPMEPPEQKREAVFDMMVQSHYGRVVWHAPIELAPGINPSSVVITGSVLAQPCDPNTCLPPQSFAFEARLGRGVALPDGTQARPTGEETAAAAPPAAPPETEPRGFDLDALDVAADEELDSTPLAVVLVFGFLGGLILNLMPCVLPVIGLKVLSFVEQAGHSRAHAFWLNMWYSVGLLSVFVILATLAVVAGLGWGGLFQYEGFNITLAAVVFVMGLSFLGVWEIPIPGFVGSGKAVEIAEKEGVAGAFTKGVLTTVLATPCSGPFLGSALAYALRQPPVQVYAIFLSVGIGMASPYLLIGAFPGLVRFLPKPGAWMDTFKQVMGFVLLGTVVYLLTLVPWPYVVPTVGLLFGLWAACWWIGRTPWTASTADKTQAWIGAIAFSVLVGVAMFGPLADEMTDRFESRIVRVSGASQPAEAAEDELPWRPFSRATLESLLAERKTVLVDFTADWCLTCKTLEALVLNTPEIRKAVEANGIVPLVADWTDGEPEVTQMLERLGSKQVPTLAIFPAETPNRPIVLRDGYTQQRLLDALEEAGPSRG